MFDLIGKKLGEYQLIDELGRTDQWVKYKAYQSDLDRFAEITILNPEFASDPSTAKRFLQSSEAASKLNHINVLQVYDFGRENGWVYRASALTEAGTVAENIAWYQDIKSALALVSQITAGLEYLYSQGIIHGNLSSDNTYLDEHRRPKLSGFGMAAGVSESDPFASPEKVQGDVIHQRSDVYSLAVMLYQMLSGTLPPAGMIVSLRAQREDIPEAVDRVVLKAMAQNPEQRFQSPNAFLNALRQAAAPQPVPPPQPPVSQTVEVHTKKGTNWTAIILGVLLAIAVAAIAFWVVSGIVDDQDEAAVLPTEPVSEQPTAEIPPTDAPAEQPTSPPEEAAPEPPPGEGELPDICGSLGFGVGIAVLGLIMRFQGNRKRTGPAGFRSHRR